MRKCHLVLFVMLALVSSHAFAQAPPKPPAPPAAPSVAAPAPPPALPAAAAPARPPAPPPPPPAPAGRESRQPINVKVDLTITEEGGNAPAVRRMVSTVAGDGFSGSVREVATVASSGAPGVLNVDASPAILPNGKIRVSFNIQYAAGQSAPPNEGRTRTDIKQSLILILESGKTLKVSEAADPIVSDRHVTVEVTATILR